MKLKAINTHVWVCQEPFTRLEVWIDEISNGIDTVDHFHCETFYRLLDTEHAAVEMWAKVALKFATPCSDGTHLPPFQLRAFVDAVQESLRHQGEENAWVKIPDIF